MRKAAGAKRARTVANQNKIRRADQSNPRPTKRNRPTKVIHHKAASPAKNPPRPSRARTRNKHPATNLAKPNSQSIPTPIPATPSRKSSNIARRNNYKLNPANNSKIILSRPAINNPAKINPRANKHPTVKNRAIKTLAAISSNRAIRNNPAANRTRSRLQVIKIRAINNPAANSNPAKNNNPQTNNPKVVIKPAKNSLLITDLPALSSPAKKIPAIINQPTINLPALSNPAKRSHPAMHSAPAANRATSNPPPKNNPMPSKAISSRQASRNPALRIN